MREQEEVVRYHPYMAENEMKIVLRVDKNLIARLDAALEKLAGPYKPPSRNSALQVAIREHIEKLEKGQK